MDKHIQIGNTYDTICCRVDSCGPYLTSYYYKIFGKSSFSILWEKYDGGSIDTDIDSATYGKWVTKYKKIELGSHDIIDDESIIDIINSSLKINDTIINNNLGGTSSDKYFITFLQPTKYITLTDSYVDH